METYSRAQAFTPFFIENILNDCLSFRQDKGYCESIASDDDRGLTEARLEVKFSDRLEPMNLCKYEDKRGPAEDDESKLLRKKKLRTTFTGRQIYELEKMFENKKYLNSKERTELSRLLNVTEQQVKIWFQNRRTKWKKQEPEDRGRDKYPATPVCPAQSTACLLQQTCGQDGCPAQKSFKSESETVQMTCSSPSLSSSSSSNTSTSNILFFKQEPAL